MFRFENNRTLLRKVVLNFDESTKSGGMSDAGSIPLTAKTLLPSSLTTIIASFHLRSHSEPILNVFQRSGSHRANPLSPKNSFSPRMLQITSILSLTSAILLWKRLLALFRVAPCFRPSPRVSQAINHHSCGLMRKYRCVLAVYYYRS